MKRKLFIIGGTFVIALAVIVCIGIIVKVKHDSINESTLSEYVGESAVSVIKEQVSEQSIDVPTDASGDNLYVTAYNELVDAVENDTLLSQYFTADDVKVKVVSGTTVIYLDNADKTGYTDKEVIYAVVDGEGGDEYSAFYDYLTNK